MEEARRAGKEVILWPNFWLNGQNQANASEIGRRYLELADAVVFKSLTEKSFFEQQIALDGMRTLMIPSGVDADFTKRTPERLFRESFDLEEYILWVGIFEQCKNQLHTIQALADLAIPVVFVGNYRDAAYHRACREAAPAHFRFLKPMQHKSDILRAALRECTLYIEPSLDPPGKSILEAAVAGANVLVCDADWTREHFGDNACYVLPDDAQSIRDGVERGLAMEKNRAFTRALRERHSFPGVLKPLGEYLENG